MKFIKNNSVYLFIILQPILDVISYFFSDNYILISPFLLRTIILVIFCIYNFFCIKDKKKCIFAFLPLIIFSFIHLTNIYFAYNKLAFSDIRNLVAIFQMPVLLVLLSFQIKEKKSLRMQIIKGVVTNLIIIFLVVLLSVIFNNYATTYLNGGITGWFNGTSTPSMILTVLSPLFLFYINKNSNLITYIISNMMVFFLLATNGTRACYYSLIILFVMMIYFNCFSKNNKKIKIVLSIIFLTLVLAYYPHSFTYLNQQNIKETINNNQNIIDDNSGKEESKPPVDPPVVTPPEEKPPVEDESKPEVPVQPVPPKPEDNNSISNQISKLNKEELIIYNQLKESYIYVYLMDIRGIKPVVDLMKGKVSAAALSNNRLVKRLNAQILYNDSTFVTKLFGLDFDEISNNGLDMENDLTAIFYYLGIIGFIIYLAYIVYFAYIALKTVISNCTIVFMPEFIIICYSILLAVGGGELTGAFLRRPNANVYLALGLCLLYEICLNGVQNKVKSNKISFLLLHLGYGGIESSTINTANALSDNYNVELISFYKLKNNQSFKINSNIKIKYIYNGEPNKEDFLIALHDKKYFKLFVEGLKAVYILICKKILVIKEIVNCDSKYLVSTRYDFSALLSAYGSEDTIKIAQEHHYHNNDKKYINVLKRKYYNIDYLFALTKTLENDYRKFLIKNKHTQVVLVPNMLYEIENKFSDLKKKNVITVSRLDKGKHVDEIIRIFDKMEDQDTRLFIIGDGDEYTNLVALIKELRLTDRVYLTGYKTKTEIEQYMLDSCVFVMASETEGLPMVLLEAMSYGVPCIAYETASGVNDIITSGYNGLVIKNRNTKDFIDALDKYINDDEMRYKMGINAKKSVLKFSKDNIVDIWNDILSKDRKNEMKKYFEKLYNKTAYSFYKDLEKELKAENKKFIVTANPETITYALSNNEISDLLLDKDTIVVPDGIGIVKAANMLGYKIPERIPGVEIAEKLFEFANKYRKSVYLFGSKQEVLDKMNDVFKEKYPNLKLAGTCNGYVKDKEKEYQKIAKLKPDIVLVALGIPAQEKLIYSHLKDFKKGIFVGVGGSFDVLSGTKKRAPRFFIKTNTEWFYRIIKEPKRLKRFWDGNVKFLFKVIKYKKKNKEFN